MRMRGDKLQSLRQIRLDNKMTIREVGEHTGISESFYCMIENGERRPSVETAKKIAAVLGFDWTLFFPDEQKGV